jgi:hypothetical protein
MGMRGVVLAVALGVPGVAAADCAGQTIMACPVEGSGKILEVCAEAKGFTYSFGPAGAPELRLAAPYSKGPVIPWAGVGRAIWLAVRFPAEGYVYEAWLSMDRLTETALTEGGVNVLAMPGEELVASIECRPGPWFGDIFAAADAMEQAGYCWDPAGAVWYEAGCP